MLKTAQGTRLDLNPQWEWVTDAVMGGVSSGRMHRTEHKGRSAVRMTGQVSLENNGGFLQMASDTSVDASVWRGVALDVFGNDEGYELRLKTSDLERPWQSFRYGFEAPARWTTVKVLFSDLEPYRTQIAFDASRLRRIGLLAVGRAFDADLAVSAVWFWR